MINPLEYMGSFGPYDGPVIDMPSVTTIAIDDRDDADTTRRLEQITRWHRRFLRPAREVILSGARPDVDGVDWVKLDKWKTHYKQAYSLWCQKELRNYFTTPFVMIWQYDGFAIDPNYWSDEFIGYDYIGAPTWYQLPHGEIRVGNGGFCIRSKFFCDEANKLPDCGDVPEDWYFCVSCRDEMMERGVRFTPIRIANQWASETCLDGCFGFHCTKLMKPVSLRLNGLIANSQGTVKLANGTVIDRFRKYEKKPDRLVVRNSVSKTIPSVVHCPGHHGAHNAESWRIFTRLTYSNSPEIVVPDEVAVITTNSLPDESILEKQCREMGVNLHVLGRDAGYWRMIYKYTLLIEFAKKTGNKYVVYIDASDARIQWDLRQCVTEIERIGCGALFGAELNSFPYGLPIDSELRRFEESQYETPWRYLNAGLMIAKSDFLRRLPNPSEDEADDQRFWKKLQRDLWPAIRIDEDRRIFQNMNTYPSGAKRGLQMQYEVVNASSAAAQEGNRKLSFPLRK